MNTRKQTVTFEPFCDGVVSLRLIDEDGNAGGQKERLRFQERTVGVKRYYEAMSAKVQIDRLIRVPYRPWLTTEYLAVLEGQVYELRQVQTVPDTRPKCSDLSLHLARQRKATDRRDADGKI